MRELVGDGIGKIGWFQTVKEPQIVKVLELASDMIKSVSEAQIY